MLMQRRVPEAMPNPSFSFPQLGCRRDGRFYHPAGGIGFWGDYPLGKLADRMRICVAVIGLRHIGVRPDAS